MEVTGLNEAYADTFMIWLNAQKVLSYSDSEYKVKKHQYQNTSQNSRKLTN